MKTISVRELKAHWAQVEEQVRNGETFEVLNRGKPSVRIVQAIPRKVVLWDNHLETALVVSGRSGQESVDSDRGGRS